jgi:UDP-2-acetamido-3-amino-2,3-dideoxy-glucuronate N-acetyltransferase
MSAQTPAPAPKIAVVGCGHWGRNLGRNFAKPGALAAVCDEDSGLAAAMAGQYGAPARLWADILDDPDITAVAVATPAATHFAIAAAAIDRGKHVFVEKPLALALNEAQELVRLAAARDVRLMVGHLLQYHPAFLRLSALTRSGELGRVHYIDSRRLNLGRIRREEDVLWSFAPHDISMILALIGREPERVEAAGVRCLDDRIADIADVRLFFPDGARAHVAVSWLHPVKEQKLTVIGSRAMAVFDDGEPWERKLTLYRHAVDWRDGLPTAQKADGESVAVDPGEPLELECAHFLHCVASGEKPRTDGAEGVRVLAVLDRAARAMAGAASPAPPASPSPLPAVPATAAQVHHTACVDTPVDLGEGTRIWHFSHILPNTRIGRDCVIGQNVSAGPDVVIGDNCKIQNNVSIYKGVTLEDGVFCGPSCVFTNVLNPRAEISRKAEFLPTLVRRGVTIGANATVVCGVELGEYCFIAAGAVVTRSVPAFALMTGAPARQAGWVSHDGERLGPDLVCPRSGRRYRLKAGGLLEAI